MSSTAFTPHDLELAARVIADAARAVEALERGTYGLCVVCDSSLGEDALLDNPLASRCNAHDDQRPDDGPIESA